jgi:hypothetical protein
MVRSYAMSSAALFIKSHEFCAGVQPMDGHSGIIGTRKLSRGSLSTGCAQNIVTSSRIKILEEKLSIEMK